MNEWIAQYAEATNKDFEIVADRNALYYGAPLNDDTLIAKNAKFTGTTIYNEWINIEGNKR